MSSDENKQIMNSISVIIDNIKEDRSIRHDFEALLVQNKNVINSSSDSINTIIKYFEQKQKDSETILNLLKSINS